MHKIPSRIKAVLASPWFFGAVVTVFVFQALWLVFSAAYPMAFDEAFHFNVIQIYAGQWSPLLGQHPEHADAFSAIHRDPSYLFHYLMSFPYRLIALFTDSQTVQIIILRLINVAFFAYSLYLFKKLFHKLGVSRALANLNLLLFTLLPIVPLLAAQINYDNLLMVVTAWFLLVAADILAGLKLRQIPIRKLALLLIIGLAGSLVKVAILPIVAATGITIITYALLKLHRLSGFEIADAVRAGTKGITWAAAAALAISLIFSSVLFIERYGVNLARFGTLLPGCSQVLTHEQCLEFGPYERNYQYRLSRSADFRPDLLDHVSRWSQGMWYRTFFMINGDLAVDRYQNYPPLPLPALTAVVILAMGMLALLLKIKAVCRQNPLGVLLLLCIAFYTFILWYNNYQSYVILGRTAALNGRYLLIILLPLTAVLSLALSRLLGKYGQLKPLLAVSVLLLFLQGGGVASFIVRSSQTWYWPHPAVQRVNTTAENLLHPLIFGSRDTHLDHIKH